jgi:hypothetical protein
MKVTNNISSQKREELTEPIIDAYEWNIDQLCTIIKNITYSTIPVPINSTKCIHV